MQIGDKFQLTLANPNPSARRTKDGPVYRLNFEVTQEEWQAFMDANLTGMVLECIAEVAHSANNNAPELPAAKPPAEPKGDYSDEAAALHRSGFFGTPKVWEAAGTPEQYAKWLRTQPCAFHGKHCPPENYDGADLKVECAHLPVSSDEHGIEGRGVGWKKRYGMVPMCHTMHVKQHTQGHRSVADDQTWLGWCVTSLERWARESIKAALNHDHWYDVPPLELKEWALSRGVGGYLPKCYRE